MFTSILVAVDGSKHAMDAVAAAVSIAQFSGGHLTLMTVPQPVMIAAIEGTMSYPMPYDKDDLDRDAKKTLKSSLALVPAELTARTTTSIIYGDPAHAIVEKAVEMDADLIVLGRRGLGSLMGILLGSTSSKVSQLAPCAVLTVK